MNSAERETRVSATVPDWSRERVRTWWDPGRQLLKAIRQYQKWNGRKGGLAAVLKRLYVVRHRYWSIVTGADIPLNCQIGGGLLIPHPNGIVIHPDVTIGPNCLISQQVTLGTNGRGLPQLGGHVDIGAGAKVLGPTRIGDHATIGANAVVLSDVPAGATAVGVPARLMGLKAPVRWRKQREKAADVQSILHAKAPPGEDSK